MADLPSQPIPTAASPTKESDIKEASSQSTNISPSTSALVEESMANEPETVKQETKELVQALKHRAQSEMQGAQQVTLDVYLGAVRKAKDSLKDNRMFDPAKIEHSMGLIQADAQKNMSVVLEEIKELGDQLGDRLSEAAQAAWDTFKQSGGKSS